MVPALPTVARVHTHLFSEYAMTASAGRTALFPIGPTRPRSYALGSPERATTAAALAEVRAADYDIGNLIGAADVRTGRLAPVVTPHEHQRQLGHVHWAGATETLQAIDAALAASHWVNACGFSGPGLMQAPEIGRLTAEQITDGAITSVDASALQLERFAASTAAVRVGLVF